MTKDPDRNRMWAWIVGFIFLALVLLGVVIWVPKWQLSGLGCVSLVKRSEVENDYRRTIVQALGGLGALLLIWIGWKNFELTRRGQNTERFSRAIDQLGATDKDGNPQLEVRLGGIYALDQLARQVPGEYRQTVVNVLTAYLRENSKHAAPKALIGVLQQQHVPGLTDSDSLLRVSQRIRKHESYDNLQMQLPRASSDFLASTEVLRRLSGKSEPMDLSDTYLRGASLKGADLRGVLLARAHLAGTDFEGVDFGPLETDAGPISANLAETNWHGATLTRARFGDADFAGATLISAKVHSADFRAVKGLTQEQIDFAEGDCDTKLPPCLSRPLKWTSSNR